MKWSSILMVIGLLLILLGIWIISDSTALVGLVSLLVGGWLYEG